MFGILAVAAVMEVHFLPDKNVLAEYSQPLWHGFPRLFSVHSTFSAEVSGNRTNLLHVVHINFSYGWAYAATPPPTWVHP